MRIFITELYHRELNKKVSSVSPQTLGTGTAGGTSVHNRFFIKAKAEVVETYSKSAENAYVYKKFLKTRGL